MYCFLSTYSLEIIHAVILCKSPANTPTICMLIWSYCTGQLALFIKNCSKAEPVFNYQ